MTEILGLFVEDGMLAAALLTWVAICAFALPTRLPPPWRAPVLALGCIVAFAASVWRSAATNGARKKPEKTAPGRGNQAIRRSSAFR
ncbi:MAG: hypothetical protein ACREQX_19660 [Candidatus Binataceae bacterium]